MRRLFVTGIGTDVGKTVVSSILVEALRADYWKPFQAGNLDESDTMMVRALVSNSESKFHPEAHRFRQPMSPHAAAALEGININFDQLVIPQTERALIIEGSGGVHVPLNERQRVIDLIEYLKAEVVVVSRHYLGSINHSILTIEALQSRNIPITGVIFNGGANRMSEDAILRFTRVRCLGRVQPETELSPAVISDYAELFRTL